MKFIENHFFPKNLIKMRCMRFHTIYFINFAAESIWLVGILFSCRISKHWNQDQIYSLPRRLGCILVYRCNSPCNEIDRLFLGCIEGFSHWLSMIVVPILEFEHVFINIKTKFIALLIWIKNLKFGPCRHFFVDIPYSNMQFSHWFFSFLNSNRQLQIRKLQRDRRTHICFEAQLCSRHRSRYTANKSVWNQAVSLVEHFRQPHENNTNNCDVHKWEIINSIELIP